MTDQQKVSQFVRRAWPVASKTLDGCLRKAWAHFGEANVGLIEFIKLLENEGFRPQQYGVFWMLRFPGRVQSVKCGGEV